MRHILLAIALIGCCSWADIEISNYPRDVELFQTIYQDIGAEGYAIRFLADNLNGIPGELLPVGMLTVDILHADGDQDALRLYLAEDDLGVVDGNPGMPYPGAMLGTPFIDYGEVPAGGWDGHVQLAPTSAFTVQEGEYYWLVGSGNAGAMYMWGIGTEAADNRIIGGIGLLPTGDYSLDSGSIPVFSLRMTLVPEPGSFALLGLAGVASVLWRRRRAA
jgi:hypothetical protein